MRTTAVLVLAVSCALAAQQPATVESTRAAFLKGIDRPRPPLAPAVKPMPDLEGGLAQEYVTFAADAQERIPALLVKHRRAGRHPVVIVLHGTGGTKEQQVARLRTLAGRGFVAVAIDGRYHGERRGPVADGAPNPYMNALFRAFQTGEEKPFLFDSVWDVMRLVDYLQTREDVDPARIGLTGISKGGMETYLTAAVDPRIAAAVPLVGVQSFKWGLDHVGAWEARMWSIREAVEAAAQASGEQISARFMRTFYDRIAPGIYGEFDAPAMLPLIAPRPLLVINGDSDGRTPLAGVRESAAAAERAYKEAGASDRFTLFLQPNTGHQVTPAADEATLEFFVKWLKPQGT